LAGRPGLRRFAADKDRIKLPQGLVAQEDYMQHRSHREFSTSALELKKLSNLLACLSSIDLNDKPKYLYASAGGLYPVQTYVYIKPDRITDLDGGVYYHDPAQHQLVHINDEDGAVREIYDPLINRPIFDKAAFAIYLVADLASIGAMYQERALHYSTLEAGHITQLLEMRAADFDIGLCQIGGLETGDLKELLQLGSSHLVLHGLLGGGISDQTTADTAPSAEDRSDERDEGEL
jgi:SagB-type dehydrogenase family enzyme